VNDNPPEFSNQSYSFDVSENVNVNYIAGRVMANDPDHGANGIVTYALGQAVLVPFTIDPNNPGNIVVSQSLDRETSPRYIFNVSQNARLAVVLQ